MDNLELFHFLDWMLNLPKEIEQTFKVQITEFEEEKKMRYVTSIERLAIEETQVKTKREDVIDILKIRFQQIPEGLIAIIQRIDDLSVLSVLHKQAVLAESLVLFEKALPKDFKEN